MSTPKATPTEAHLAFAAAHIVRCPWPNQYPDLRATVKAAAQLIADSEARAVEAATTQLRSELNYAKASETLYHDEGTQLREKVRVLREALDALAYWSRNNTETRQTLRDRIRVRLDVTKEDSP